jgi:hypothetical protein
VGGVYWEQSRSLHQVWADRLSDREYADIRAALRSDDAQARSAFMELYLHECLIRTGREVIIHPEVPGSTRHPDFLAVDGATQVFVEAIVPGPSKKQTSSSARLADVLAAIDEVGDPNFMIMTIEIVQGPRSAAGANARQKIRDWLAELDPDSVEPQNPPTFTWDNQGWRVSVQAIPRRRGNRTAGPRSIGIYAHTEAEFIDDGPRIRTALNSKTRAYGDLASPLVIAVGTHAFDDDEDDVNRALFGSVEWLIRDSSSSDLTGQAVRKRDGYFGSPGVWRNRRVSGVLIVDQLHLHDPTNARVTLWLHPEPLHALPDDPMFPGTIREWDGEQLISREGLDARDLLDLDEPWPEGDPWK